jgi:glycosyltransferase involved in cell wall biosynthesis
MHPMRIAILRVGGWENWVDTVASFLARNGAEVTGLVYLREITESFRTSPGVKLITEVAPLGMLGKFGTTCRMGSMLRSRLARNKFDVLYVVDSWSIPTLWFATMGRFHWRKLPLVYHTFEWLDSTVHNPLQIHLERAICRKADLVVNIDRMRGRIQQMLYGLPKPPLWVRTSLSREYPLPEPLPERRREMLGANPPDDAVSVFCPSIASQDRLALELICSFAQLPDRFRLAAIAGCDDYFASCVKTVQRLGLSHRVTFLPRMPFDRVMEYVVCADVGAVLHDGRRSLGNYLANPMRLTMFAAAGIPFVSSNFPTLAGEVYRHGLGVCCDEHNPEAIGDAIRTLTQGSTADRGLKRRIVDTFRSTLCFEANACTLLQRLRQLAGQTSGTHLME